MHYFPYRPTGIYSLPVELLTRIFVLGAGYDYPYDGSPFLLKPDQDYYAIPSSNFQLLVSHVCQHWRQIALRTSCLWNILHFREPAHFARAEEYLARCSASGQLLDILVDTVAQQDHIPGVTLCRGEIQVIFDIIIPHVKRWRAFHLKVRDNECKGAARQHLSTCGPAPNLETLQLYHFEDYRTSQNLYLATYRPPVMVFNNSLPRLRNVSLIGVNLPWAQSPYLAHLHNLELALHPENIRPPYEYWDHMLRNSPELQTLSLHYSGPRVENGDTKLVWPTTRERIYIETLQNLSLTDLDPDYLCLLMERLILPGVTKLSLDLPDQDFTPFIELIAGAKPPILSGDLISSSLASHSSPSTPSTLSPSSPSNGLSPVSATSTLSTSYLSLTHLPLPVLAKLETLIITALECNTDSLRAFLRPLEGLKTLEVHFPRVGECFHGLFMETIAMEIDHDKTTVEEMSFSSEKASMFSQCPHPTPTPSSLNIICDPLPVSAQRHVQIIPLLPRLRTFKMSGLPGEKVAQLIKFRQGPWGQPHFDNGQEVSERVFEVEEWVVGWHERRRGKDVVLDRLVDEGWVGDDGTRVKVGTFEEDGEEEEEEEEADDGEMEEEEGEDEN